MKFNHIFKTPGNLLFLICFIPALSSEAQILDSLKQYFSHRPTLTFRLDNKTSFISSNSVSIWGVNLGLDFNKKLKTGFGYYFLNSLIREKTKIPIEHNDTVVNARLLFNYGGIFFEYVFYATDKWEMSFPLHIGFGESKYRYHLPGRTFDRGNHFLALYEANICAQYKLAYWLGGGFGIGYRIMLINDNISDGNFSAPIYAIKIKIFFGDLYRTYFPDAARNNSFRPAE